MPGEVIQTDGSRLFRTRVNGSDEQYVNPLAEKDGMPGYAVQWMEVDGPLADASTGAGYRLLFGELPMKRVDAGQPGVALDVVAPAGTGGFAGRAAAGPPGRGGAAGRGGRGGARPAQVVVDVVSSNPREDAERLFALS